MPTVQEDIDLPGGVDPEDVIGTLTLWGAGVPASGIAGTTRIHGPRRFTGASWSIDNVVGNTAIEPSGTVYRVERTWPGLDDPLVHYISVPSSGGPYQVEELLADPPDDLPTLTPSNELDVAERTSNLTVGTFNGFNIIAVPDLIVTVPDVPRPCWVELQLWMEHAGSANANLTTLIAAPGSSIIGQQIAAGTGFVGAQGKETSPFARARIAPNTPGDWQAFVYTDTAGSVTLIANGSNPLRMTVLGV